MSDNTKYGALRNHGLSYTSEYRAWQTMRLRCLIPTNPAYADYGGRGIKVCDRWLDNPQAFVDDMGLKPTPKHELDREDNDGDYHPGNCRWVTRATNDRNRRSNRWVTYKGRRMVLVEAVELSGLPVAAVSKRLQKGWSEERALSEPVRPIAAKGEGFKAPPMTNKTGLKGVKTSGDLFCARVMVNGRRFQSRGFRTPEEAHDEYVRLTKTS